MAKADALKELKGLPKEERKEGRKSAFVNIIIYICYIYIHVRACVCVCV